MSVVRGQTSLYADDAAIFINASKPDLDVIKGILQAFGNITGLVTNFEKSSIHPIRCENIHLQEILQHFPDTCSSFPCKYLGTQLHTPLPSGVGHTQPAAHYAPLPLCADGLVASVQLREFGDLAASATMAAWSG